MPSLIAVLVPTLDRLARVQNVTGLLLAVTNAAVRAVILRGTVTFFVAGLTFPVMAADTLHPLSQAARRAVALCITVDAESLDHCGTRMLGRSAAHSTARTAVKQYFDQLAAFLIACGREERRACRHEAEWLTVAGMASATQPASDR